MIDATRIFQRFGDFSFGTVQATTIHISSREDFEDDKDRMKRDLWKQIENHNATFACESKIFLSYDHMN
jgi:hypothetical protein